MRTIFLVLATFAITISTNAQTSRRSIEKFASEAIKQISITGRKPTIDLLDSLANNAEISIEMLSRMNDPDDTRQQRACLHLITDIVDYSQLSTGRKYTDVVRKGLTKALDRSYDTDVQLLVMEQLGKCAKPADATHIAMYLEVPALESTAYRILISMPDIDDRIAEAAVNQPGIKAKVRNILDVRAGRESASKTMPMVAYKKPEPITIPMWTESLNRAIYDMCHEPQPSADSIVINHKASVALPELLSLAGHVDATRRNDILARCVILNDRAMESGDLTADESYIILRNADELATDNTLRRKIILSFGQTHSIQALSYLRRYTGKPDYADAMAIASTEIICSRPDANGGRAVNTMLYAAKQSFIRHYDEAGIDNYIDQVLAAIDNWNLNAGYDMSHTDNTRMEKRGFWILHDELKDVDLVFDWRAKGTLELCLRSAPLASFNRELGIKVRGDGRWHKFEGMGDWSTARVSLRGNVLNIMVNGQKLIDNMQIRTSSPNEPLAKSGQVRFLADEDGAEIRQYSFLRE